MLFARLEIGVTYFYKHSQNRKRKQTGLFFVSRNQTKTAIFKFQWHSMLRGDFSFFLAPVNPNLFFWGGARVKLQNWLGSVHPGAYTSMPHPRFGAKAVCYIKKKVLAK